MATYIRDDIRMKHKKLWYSKWYGILNKTFQIPMLLGHVANWQLPIDTILFSGGVSQCIYPRADSNCEMGEFDDIGRHIAKACMANSELQQFEWMEPLETVRATVMGAGAQSTDVSGATIEIDGAVLLLKNVPVL